MIRPVLGLQSISMLISINFNITFMCHKLGDFGQISTIFINIFVIMNWILHVGFMGGGGVMGIANTMLENTQL